MLFSDAQRDLEVELNKSFKKLLLVKNKLPDY